MFEEEVIWEVLWVFCLKHLAFYYSAIWLKTVSATKRFSPYLDIGYIADFKISQISE